MSVAATGRGIEMGALLQILNNMRQRFEEVRFDPLAPPLGPLESLRNLDREQLKRIVFGDAPVTNIASTALGAYFVSHLAVFTQALGNTSIIPNSYLDKFVIGLCVMRSNGLSWPKKLLEFAIGLPIGVGVMSCIEKITGVASSAITPVATEALRISTDLQNRILRLYDIVNRVWNLSDLDPAPAIR